MRTVQKIMTAGALLFAAVVLAAPAGATSDNGNNGNAEAKRCHAEKKADAEAFKALYGPKQAMRNCIKGAPTPEEVAEFKNAAQECKAEREADPTAFETTYGTGHNGRNALGKCVSQKVHEDDETA